jgi:hypothetical protein
VAWKYWVLNNKTGIFVIYTMKNKVCNSFWQVSSRKCLEVDPIPGINYSHRIISEYSIKKLKGDATRHVKRARRWPEPKFDDYTQNSSEMQSKFNFNLKITADLAGA